MAKSGPAPEQIIGQMSAPESCPVLLARRPIPRVGPLSRVWPNHRGEKTERGGYSAPPVRRCPGDSSIVRKSIFHKGFAHPGIVADRQRSQNRRLGTSTRLPQANLSPLGGCPSESSLATRPSGQSDLALPGVFNAVPCPRNEPQARLRNGLLGCLASAIRVVLNTLEGVVDLPQQRLLVLE